MTRYIIKVIAVNGKFNAVFNGGDIITANDVQDIDTLVARGFVEPIEEEKPKPKPKGRHKKKEE